MNEKQDVTLALEEERAACVSKIFALRQQRGRLNEMLDNEVAKQGVISEIVNINKKLNSLRDRISQIDTILHPCQD